MTVVCFYFTYGGIHGYRVIFKNFMSVRGEIKVISMKPHSTEDTDLYVKGRGCGNLGTGIEVYKNTIFGALGPRV